MAVAGLDDLVAAAFQCRSNELAEDGLVVAEQDPGHPPPFRLDSWQRIGQDGRDLNARRARAQRLRSGSRRPSTFAIRARKAAGAIAADSSFCDVSARTFCFDGQNAHASVEANRSHPNCSWLRPL